MNEHDEKYFFRFCGEITRLMRLIDRDNAEGYDLYQEVERNLQSFYKDLLCDYESLESSREAIFEENKQLKKQLEEAFSGYKFKILPEKKET